MGEQYVAIDLHRRRSVIVRQDADGEVLEEVRIDNDPVALALEIAKAGHDPEVVLEATYGWYWAADVLEANGARVHLAHPLGVTAFRHRRVKNDSSDVRTLADLLRMNRLPEAWLAPPEIRELRELVRYRAKLVALCTGLKSQVRAVLGKQGVKVPLRKLFGIAGNKLLDELSLDGAYALRLESLRELISVYDGEVFALNRTIEQRLSGHAGYVAIQRIPGVGSVLGAVFVAEIGDISRFSSPAKLCSWAGVTPKHRESDVVIRRGHITKQGSRLVRWAAVEAVARVYPGTKRYADFYRIAERRGHNIARMAMARKLLTLVFYGMRDGHIRCLSRLAREAA